jgi:hypothetical protein
LLCTTPLRVFVWFCKWVRIGRPITRSDGGAMAPGTFGGCSGARERASIYRLDLLIPCPTAWLSPGLLPDDPMSGP